MATKQLTVKGVYSWFTESHRHEQLHDESIADRLDDVALFGLGNGSPTATDVVTVLVLIRFSTH